MTGLSTFAIVASAAFWAALWGPIGLILATPLTVGLLVIGRNIESLKFFDVLLGSEPVLTPEHAFYQRLLASDPLEAAEQADVYLKEERLDGFINEVAVPGLMLANHDHLRGVLSVERQTVVAHSFSEMLDEVWPEDAGEETAAPVLLVSAHGPLNFAATLAFSALLKTKNIPHEMLPEDVIAPGKFPQIDMANVGICLPLLFDGAQRSKTQLCAPAIDPAGERSAHSECFLGRIGRPCRTSQPGKCRVAFACHFRQAGREWGGRGSGVGFGNTGLIRGENGLHIIQAERFVEHADEAKVSLFGKGFRLCQAMCPHRSSKRWRT